MGTKVILLLYSDLYMYCQQKLTQKQVVIYQTPTHYIIITKISNAFHNIKHKNVLVHTTVTLIGVLVLQMCTSYLHNGNN